MGAPFARNVGLAVALPGGKSQRLQVLPLHPTKGDPLLRRSASVLTLVIASLFIGAGPASAGPLGIPLPGCTPDISSAGPQDGSLGPVPVSSFSVIGYGYCSQPLAYVAVGAAAKFSPGSASSLGTACATADSCFVPSGPTWAARDAWVCAIGAAVTKGAPPSITILPSATLTYCDSPI